MTDEHHAHEHHAHDLLDHADAVEQSRAQKDAYLPGANDSPIPVAERESFTGLPYYPVGPRLRFDELVLQPYAGDGAVYFEIPTNDG